MHAAVIFPLLKEDDPSIMPQRQIVALQLSMGMFSLACISSLTNASITIRITMVSCSNAETILQFLKKSFWQRWSRAMIWSYSLCSQYNL